MERAAFEGTPSLQTVASPAEPSALRRDRGAMEADRDQVVEPAPGAMTPEAGSAEPRSEMSTPRGVVLSVQNFRKDYGAFTALEGTKLEILDGEFFTLLGPSGCGKTTLLRIVAGFTQPTTGQILLDGKDIGAEPPYRRPINTMFQSYALFPHLNVRRNVSFGLEMLGWSRADIAARVAEVLRLVRMEDLADRRVAQLSGGQQQRIALVRALAPRPRLLLLDEPLSALDLKLRKAMQAELKRLQQQTKLTFIMVTHDQEEALALSDRIAVMHEGRLQQVGTPTEIYAHPVNGFVADFIGEANLIPGPLLGEAADRVVVIRPEAIGVAPASGPDTRKLACTVSLSTYLGADTLLECRLDDGTMLRARCRGALHEAQRGERVTLSWNRSSEWTVSA